MKRVSEPGPASALLPRGAPARRTIFEKVGTYAAQFLKIGVSARATAMGSAFTALADDASAAYWNPAGLVERRRDRRDAEPHRVAGGHQPRVRQLHVLARLHPGQDVAARARSDHGSAGGAHHLPPAGHGRACSTPATCRSACRTRATSPTSSPPVDTVSWMHMGLADQSVNSFVVDFGLLYRIGIRGMKLGMAVQNIGSEVDFDERASKLPTVFKVGSVGRHVPQRPALAGRGRRVLASVGQQGTAECRRSSTRTTTSSSCVPATTSTTTPRRSRPVPACQLQTSQSTAIDADYSFVDMGALGGVHRVSLAFTY